eukprot:m.69588 g.69588  ORF g.69588 m.69588 type:complete len:416 (+) comp9972_c0_seq4:138-1385(+)
MPAVVSRDPDAQLRKRKRIKDEEVRNNEKARRRRGQGSPHEPLDKAAEVRAIQKVPEVRSQFKILDVIGSGTFSTVYKAQVKGKRAVLALKRILQSCRSKFIDKEAACLHKLRGEHHVVFLHSVYTFEDAHVLVLDYLEHEDFTEYYQELSVVQVRGYMKALLEALAHVHKHRIVHRDVKPANFLHSRKARRFLLVDFGLAQDTTEAGIENLPPQGPRKVVTKQDFENTLGKAVRIGTADRDGGPGKMDHRQEQMTVRAGTRGFRAPEVLLRCPIQSPAIDIWSAGVIMLSILSGTSPYFMSNRDVDGLVEIANVCGPARISALATFYGKDLLLGQTVGPHTFTGSADDLRRLCEDISFPDHPAHKPHPIGDFKYSLLEQLLTVEPHQRITAEEALKHPFISGHCARGLQYNQSL